MDLISAGAPRATAPQQRTILAHYERVAPLIVANFPNVPLVFTYYPDGLGTGDPDLPMATPFDWTEIDTLRNGEITATNAPDRLAKGDIFAALAAKLAHQRFAALDS